MQTKSLLYGLAGFFIGGLVVSIAATTINKPDQSNSSDMTMSQMVGSLKDRKGDDYDKAFIEEMIMHHQGAIDMAKLSATNAKHDEVKQLSNDILSAQSKEVDMMQTWQAGWGYKTTPQSHGAAMSH